ncbi:leucine-rich repeat domain-containing protein, partial [Brachyspira intermedia]|uniref:leucine-rich repeat domain-containing protein n=1 Tax=Brachyspira intermedia TaxID=84377 RepID=UPI003004A773
PENMFYAYDPEKNDYFLPFYNFIFPENRITTIGKYAFELNWCIKEIVIPDSVITMGFAAFSNCDRLEKITLGKGIKRIDEILVFGYCDVLKEVDTSRCSSLEYLGGYTLYELPAITEFAIPASVKEIAASVFYECDNLTTVIYYGDSPNNVTFLDKRSIFSYCPEVKNLIVPNAINPDDHAWDTFGNANFTYVGREKPKQ